MSPAARSALGAFLAVVALGALAGVLLPRLLGLASGPEGEIITLLKRVEHDGLQLEVAGSSARLRSEKLSFDRIGVTVLPKGQQAQVTATLDFTGWLGETQVSSVGLERIRFQYQDFSWKPAEGYAPRLLSAVSLLELRRRALEKGELGRLSSLGGEGERSPELAQLLSLEQRRYRALGWFIRSEREEVLVREEYRLLGSLPQRPLDEVGARRLRLIEREGKFIFSGGIM